MNAKKERSAALRSYMEGAATIPDSVRYLSISGLGPSWVEVEAPGAEELQDLMRRIRARRYSWGVPRDAEALRGDWDSVLGEISRVATRVSSPANRVGA